MAEPLRLDPRKAQLVAHTAFWAGHPFAFLTQCCFTRDEVDKDRVKLIPPKPHIRQLVYEWEHYRLLAIPKSRRMIVTWTLIALDLWLAMFRRYSRINIISSDQTKSDSLVGRRQVSGRRS